MRLLILKTINENYNVQQKNQLESNRRLSIYNFWPSPLFYAIFVPLERSFYNFTTICDNIPTLNLSRIIFKGNKFTEMQWYKTFCTGCAEIKGRKFCTTYSRIGLERFYLKSLRFWNKDLLEWIHLKNNQNISSGIE